MPVEMLLEISGYCQVVSIKNLYICNKYLEETFVSKTVLFYLLKRIFKENQRYSHLLFSKIGKTIIATTLGNFHGINEPDVEVPVDPNHHIIS